MLYTVGNSPVIAKNPISTFIIIRNNFTSISLTCEVGGASSYYWQRQHGNIPSRSTGINTNNLTIINLQLKDTGNYRCVGINGSGSIASEYATLTFEGTYMILCTYVCIAISYNIYHHKLLYIDIVVTGTVLSTTIPYHSHASLNQFVVINYCSHIYV